MNGNYREALCYFDTNILVYLFDKADPAKQRLSKDLMLHFHRKRTGRISVQVIAEWRNVMIKKFGQFVDKDVRRRFIKHLGGWKPFAISPTILLKADELCDRYTFSPYDSIHVQCALELGCQYLLSEDMQDGLVVDRALTLCNPYKRLVP